MKFHGEDTSILGDKLLRFSSTGIFAYSTFNIVAGGLGVHTDLKNLLVFATGAITIIQVRLSFDKKHFPIEHYVLLRGQNVIISVFVSYSSLTW